MEIVDTHQLDWLNLSLGSARVTGIPQVVSDVLPSGYPAYCRILNTLRLPRDRETRWSEVAAEVGLPLSAQTKPEDLAAALPQHQQDEFWTGIFSGLSDHMWDRIGEALERATTSKQLMVARWEGIGGEWPMGVKPREVRPGWRYYLLRTGLDDFPNLLGSSQMIWPGDRAWVLNEDVNTRATYIAGPDTLIDELTDSAALDCFSVAVSDPAW